VWRRGSGHEAPARSDQLPPPHWPARAGPAGQRWRGAPGAAWTRLSGWGGAVHVSQAGKWRDGAIRTLGPGAAPVGAVPSSRTSAFGFSTQPIAMAGPVSCG
jgi:hypothetical protein